MTHSSVISDYSNQNLSVVPETVLEMTNLKMLYLNGNAIESLPETFFVMLNKLSWLDIRKNKLTNLPVSIGNHKCLENLLLQGNLIEELPNELGLVPNLKVLQLSDNPLVYPPPHIIEAGVDDILIYLKQEYYKLHSPAPTINAVSDNYSLISSNTSFADSQDFAAVHQQTQTLENMPALLVKSLGKQLKKRKESHIDAKCSRNKRVHEIIKSSSKFSVRSHYNSEKYLGMKEGKSQNQIIDETELKDLWLSRLKALIDDQEKIIQQEKTLGALSSWRLEKKSEPIRSPSNLEIIPEAPFDTDPEYNRLMSRTDMTENIDKLIAAKRKSHNENVDIETMITNVVSKLRGIEHKLQEPVSPAQKLKNAEQEIQMIVDLHKKIAQIQLSNDTMY